ncbi:hypothetical protein EBZ38_04725 [bacterium]|nr:hypothetical protein [bacterium]
MRVLILTSMSDNISDIINLTAPNKLEYCLKHGYSFLLDNQPYQNACERMSAIIPLFEEYSIIWNIDADTVITNMNIPIHSLECLGDHMTVCEENMVYWNRINCGSVVYKNTPQTKWLLQQITDNKDKWKHLVCQAQTWLADISEHLGDIITIAPANSFNSVEWNLPANSAKWGPPGNNWRQGDLLYHPCSVFPKQERIKYLQNALNTKVIH